jgi:glucose-1-phosphate adenylyltransferase
MDILDRPEEINLRDREWRIYSRNPVKPAHYIATSARVVNSAMTDGCNVCGTVEHSVLFNSVTVEKGAVVRDSILLPGVTVEAGAHLDKCIVGISTVIGKDVRAGAGIEGECKYSNSRLCQDGITVFERGLKIRDAAIVPGNCMVEYDEPDEIVETHFRV